MSVDPRLEKFNIESNDHGRTQKSDFCIPVCKANFTDHHTPHTIMKYGFRDSVLVCKMYDCTIRKNSISIPSHQAMQATTICKTTEYLCMKGVLDFIELRMLRRADYMRESIISLESHKFTATERRQYLILGRKSGGQIVIPSRSSVADSRLYEMFKATDK